MNKQQIYIGLAAIVGGYLFAGSLVQITPFTKAYQQGLSMAKK